jgi:hypothetical protein
MHPDIDESTEVRDICDRGGQRSGGKRPSLADIGQTTSSVNKLGIHVAQSIVECCKRLGR